MPRWMRIVRGMFGMGLIFSLAVLAVTTTLGGIAFLFGAWEREMLIMVVGSAIWAFPIGLAFSGFMALTARGRTFDKISLPRVALLGAGGGLLLYGVLALNAWSAWTTNAAVVNAVFLVGLGSVAASGSLLLARKAGPSLKAGDDPDQLGEG